MVGNYGITTEKDVLNEIETLKKVFSSVRLLFAEEVGARTRNCVKKRIDGNCYEIWKRKKPCKNCISYRALTEKKQFSKIEKANGGTFQVIADYREVDGEPCVLEMIKEFDENMMIDFGSEERTGETLTEYFDKTYTDVLTGTYNRRYYEEYVSGETFFGGIAMIDLDDFKIYNDLFGHSVGDAVLKAVASVIKNSVRSGDTVIRYGGDEFLLVLSGVRKDAFARCLRGIGTGVKDLVFDEYPAIKPSVSTGFVICSGQTIKEVINRADEFMYLAKKKKNYIVTDGFSQTDGERDFPKKERVLIVDDSAFNREILSGILKNEYEVIEAENGRQAITQMNGYGADVSAVLLDLIMPEMSGFELLDYMNERNMLRDLPVIAITGDESNDSMRIAYEKGVSDYITRPFDAKVVYRRVSNTVKVYARQKKLISRITGETKSKEKNRNMIVEILSQIVEHPDGDDNGTHAGHMMKFTELILEKLIRKKTEYGIEEKDVYVISTASALHDIGKSRIDGAIIDKKGRLTPEEFEIVKTHTILGERMLKNIKAYEKEPLLKYAREICRHHHERFDGKGYPDGLVGDEIPVSAQVVSVCDVYDALISKRAYKPAYSHLKAMEIIKNGECGAFNPLLIECLEECADDLKKTVEEGKKKVE